MLIYSYEQQILLNQTIKSPVIKNDKIDLKASLLQVFTI